MHSLKNKLTANAVNIIKAIDTYLVKADKELEEQLDNEGFLSAKKTVKNINKLEKKFVDILNTQTKTVVDAVEDIEDIEDIDMESLVSNSDITSEVATAAESTYESVVPNLASKYMKESDGELVIDTLRQRTYDWFKIRSKELGEYVNNTTQGQISNLIEQAVNDGLSVADTSRKIIEGEWRSEYYQAKRIAMNEMLLAHSVAREEAIQQSSASETKEWRHTGSHKNNPRENHVDMDGQIVPKDQPFELVGADGTTYFPMYPRDPLLPASESINCHCIHRGIPSEEVLGLSLEERKELQQQIIEEDNELYEGEHGNIERIGKVDKAEINNKLDEYTDGVRNKTVEHSYIINKHGSIFHAVGDNEGVNFDGIDLDNASITHNHAKGKGDTSFGKDDFEFLKDNNKINKLVATSTKYNHTVSDVKDISKLSYSELYREAMLSANVMDENIDLHHDIFAILNERGYLKYERTEIE